MTKNKELLIKAENVFDGETYLGARYITISGTTISAVSKTAPAQKTPDFSGIVTPAFIDPHSHIGMIRGGEPGDEQEGNDYSQQILPLSDPLNSIYFDDDGFREAVDFGVLYSCVMPGSGNVFGGKSTIIRNFANNRSDAVVKEYGYKMALGYNPRGTTSWKGERPNTRMGVYQMLEKRFDEVIAKEAKAALERERKIIDLKRKEASKKISAKEAKEDRSFIEREYGLALSSEEKALYEAATGKKVVKVHVHKEDDVFYLLSLVKRYGMKVTAEHTGDVFHQEVFSALHEANIPIVYGPLGSFAYKTELKHSYYQNTKALMDSGAEFGLMTDHPVILASNLRESLKFFLIQGMTPEKALNLLTKKNAQILGIDREFGSIAVGKKASLLVWDQDPLNLAAFPKSVIGEGVVLRANGAALKRSN